MPEHLGELKLSGRAQDLVDKLNLWLGKNGSYTPVAGKQDLLQCIREGWEGETFSIGDEVAKMITKERYWIGIAKAQDNTNGVWLKLAGHAQYLISARTEAGITPTISDGRRNIPFGHGTMVYCAPDQYVHVGGGIEFVQIHWSEA